jgi:hypothetical protein
MHELSVLVDGFEQRPARIVRRPVLRFFGSSVLRFFGSSVLRFFGSSVLRFFGSSVLLHVRLTTLKTTVHIRATVEAEFAMFSGTDRLFWEKTNEAKWNCVYLEIGLSSKQIQHFLKQQQKTDIFLHLLSCR